MLQLLGRALKGFPRESVLICTKVRAVAHLCPTAKRGMYHPCSDWKRITSIGSLSAWRFAAASLLLHVGPCHILRDLNQKGGTVMFGGFRRGMQA